MQIFLGADHRGFALKDKIEAYLAKRNYPVEDIGALVYDDNDDFPQFAAAAALKIIGSEDDDPRAILICGGGQGMAMAANRFSGIRAVVISTVEEAKMSRLDNDSNVLSLSSELMEASGDELWQGIIETWLTTPFSGKERFIRRNKQLDELN
jgi:ribose 5-phosphate isomerase B